jgi:hypothetical protein
MNASARMRHVCVDAGLRPCGRIFTSSDGKIHPRGKCRRVRTVNFTIGRPFRHPCPGSGRN